MVKVLFFGTPDIAVPTLDWLVRHSDVAGVVCRPDEPAGRGHELTAPPTKRFAEQKGIRVFQPTGPWTDETTGALQKLNADIGLIVAYGRILPRPVFSAPKLGCVNIHFSLLPKYRGAAPMQWALINGETETGVSAFWLEEGLDSGPLFAQTPVPIHPEDDISLLREKLVPVGVDIVEKLIDSIPKGQLARESQKGEPTFAPQLKKEDGRIRWKDKAVAIANLVRGVCEWPGAFTHFHPDASTPKQLKVFKSEAREDRSKKPIGSILDARAEGIAVQTGDGVLVLREVQPEGKKRMAAWDFWQGARMKVGDKFE